MWSWIKFPHVVCTMFRSYSFEYVWRLMSWRNVERYIHCSVRFRCASFIRQYYKIHNHNIWHKNHSINNMKKQEKYELNAYNVFEQAGSSPFIWSMFTLRQNAECMFLEKYFCNARLYDVRTQLSSQCFQWIRLFVGSIVTVNLFRNFVSTYF